MTPYPYIDEMLNFLLVRLPFILGQKWVGGYLYGSLVTGDFDETVSDIDLVMALSADLDEIEFAALDKMHNDFVATYPNWENRLEIAYIAGLGTFKSAPASPKIGIISPGEPFHIIEMDKGWLMNWYIVREKGVTLFGPSPKTVIEPVSQAEYAAMVRSHALRWSADWIGKHHGSQAYAILTMCRALYTLRFGEQPSKIQAAAWAKQELPEWAGLIDGALGWRQAQNETWAVADNEATLPETRRFVAFMIEKIEKTVSH